MWLAPLTCSVSSAAPESCYRVGLLDSKAPGLSWVVMGVAFVRENGKEPLGYRLLGTAPPLLAHYCYLGCFPLCSWAWGWNTGLCVPEASDLLLNYNPESCFLETEFSCVVQADLELAILLPPPCKCWGHKNT